MIYYFSGTGNSKFIAYELGKRVGDSVLEMSIDSLSAITKGNKFSNIGFVFPVYAWGIPQYVKFFLNAFIYKYHSDIYDDFEKFHDIQSPYIYVVLTCGDDVGKTAKEFAKILNKNNLHVSASWSIKMPNTYIAFPGFDIDKTTIQREKIGKSIERITQISNMIKCNIDGIYDVYEGILPQIKSFILKPLFDIFLSSSRNFHVISNQCVSCGKCVKECHLNNILLNEVNGKLIPILGKNCTQCFSCYHHCPRHAIRWGIFTNQKGQYLFKIVYNLIVK